MNTVDILGPLVPELRFYKATFVHQNTKTIFRIQNSVFFKIQTKHILHYHCSNTSR